MLSLRTRLLPRNLVHFSNAKLIILRRWNQDAASQRRYDILYFGRDEFSCDVFRALHAAKDVWGSLCVTTQPDARTGRNGRELSISPLKELAHSLDIPVSYIPQHKNKFKEWQPPEPFTSANPTHILITASFGRIIPDSLLNLFDPLHRINVHPSLLPLYRGAAPIQHAIMRGDTETGVSIITMKQRRMGIDTGDIFAQEVVKIPEESEMVPVRDTLAQIGGQLLVSVLRNLLNGNTATRPQKPIADAPLAPIITLNDAILDFTKMTADEIVRRYRAISHQKTLKAFLANFKEIGLYDVTVVTPPAGAERLDWRVGTAHFFKNLSTIVIRCANNTWLSVPYVQERDRKKLAAKEWWNGARYTAPHNGVRFLTKRDVWTQVGFLKEGSVFNKMQLMKKAERTM